MLPQPMCPVVRHSFTGSQDEEAQDEGDQKSVLRQAQDEDQKSENKGTSAQFLFRGKRAHAQARWQMTRHGAAPF